jgi:A/G-specific adenine glycosylase
MAGNQRDLDQFFSQSARKPEHKILWTSKVAAGNADAAPGLRRFFKNFAKNSLRHFPWRRKNVGAFHLLLAEVLLVQTKAEDVAVVWPQLVRRYPTPKVLSTTSRKSLVKLLRPLGLQRQRAKSLVAIGKTLAQFFGGRVPRSPAELLSIPHVGLYTATAVSCFAFGERLPIVDANVLRVLGRIHGTKTGSDLRRSRDAWLLAWAILPKKDSRMHNYGLLDFAAQVCTAKQPRCESCSLSQTCCFGRKHLAGLGSQT